MADDSWATYDYRPNDLRLRQFELDIDLKIIRAAKHGEALSYAFYQMWREKVLGSKLNIRCRYQPGRQEIFEPSISAMR